MMLGPVKRQNLGNAVEYRIDVDRPLPNPVKGLQNLLGPVDFQINTLVGVLEHQFIPVFVIAVDNMNDRITKIGQ